MPVLGDVTANLMAVFKALRKGAKRCQSLHLAPIEDANGIPSITMVIGGNFNGIHGFPGGK
jgi:hypothetical protein